MVLSVEEWKMKITAALKNALVRALKKKKVFVWRTIGQVLLTGNVQNIGWYFKYLWPRNNFVLEKHVNMISCCDN